MVTAHEVEALREAYPDLPWPRAGWDRRRPARGPATPPPASGPARPEAPEGTGWTSRCP